MAAVSGWLRRACDCLEAVEREQAGAAAAVVDHEVVAPAGGGPEDLAIWLVCRTARERREFADHGFARFNSALRQRLLAAGFPEPAVATLAIGVTSREAVEAAGGRFPRGGRGGVRRGA